MKAAGFSCASNRSQRIFFFKRICFSFLIHIKSIVQLCNCIKEFVGKAYGKYMMDRMEKNGCCIEWTFENVCAK